MRATRNVSYIHLFRIIKNMIDREDYRLFLAIADTGSLSRAAKLLHLTPSAVSRRLRDMETRLNVRLVNRTTRVLQLTQAGERFCIASRRVIAAMEDAESSIQELLHPVTGVLRLTSTPGFGCMVLPGLLAAFVQNYPGIQVELATSHEPTNLHTLRRARGLWADSARADD
jgi:LysR family transcriptional activator of dmlA